VSVLAGDLLRLGAPIVGPDQWRRYSTDRAR
jgi:hypothetical protein